MVARKGKSLEKRTCSRCASTDLNVHVELDNKALRGKNINLTQALAKLQKENAELVKQLNFLQEESFEITSRYNNLKNVISIIDSTTKTYLPKLMEIVDNFTGVIQLCSVAINISSTNNINNTNKELKTQAVKPHIVNGHILHNPTITLARFDNGGTSTSNPTTSSRSVNVTMRPNTSSNLANVDMEENQEEDDTDSEKENEDSFDGAGTSRRRRQFTDIQMMDMSIPENSNGEVVQIPEIEEENSEEFSEARLSPIQEESEKESPHLSRSLHSTYLKGSVQEVRIYLNQLPEKRVNDFRRSGNISISVSSPERNSSSFNGTLQMNEHDSTVSARGSSPKLSLSFRSSSPIKSYDFSKASTSQYNDNISAIRASLSVPTTSVINDSVDSKLETMRDLGLTPTNIHQKTSTPIMLRKSGDIFNESDFYNTGNKSSRNESPVNFKTNITKRKTTSRDKRKVAQVILDRLSLENRNSLGSPMEKIKNIVNSPPLMNLYEIKTRLTRRKGNENFNEETILNKKLTNTERTKNRKDSPTKKISNFKNVQGISKNVAYSPKKTSGRPKRAARPASLKEPSLTKKMRRSK